MATASVKVDTYRYGVNHHPRTPRGYGLWYFEDAKQEQLFSFTGTYGEAAKAARKWGRELGLATVYTCG